MFTKNSSSFAMEHTTGRERDMFAETGIYLTQLS